MPRGARAPRNDGLFPEVRKPARTVNLPASDAPVRKCDLRRFFHNDYMMAKSEKAFRRAALLRGKTARLFCHILIAMSIGRMILRIIRCQTCRLAAKSIEFSIDFAIRWSLSQRRRKIADILYVFRDFETTLRRKKTAKSRRGMGSAFACAVSYKEPRNPVKVWRGVALPCPPSLFLCAISDGAFALNKERRG